LSQVAHPPIISELPLLDDRPALLEAERCLHCGGPLELAPCTLACPADLDIPAFLGALARGSWEDAATLLFAENLLAASCGRLCPAGELCEGHCVLGSEGKEPIAIRRLERYAADLAFRHPWATFRTSSPATGRRVAVIGAGPAGLVCAGELAARGHAVTLHEAGPEYGGGLRPETFASREDESHLPDEVRAIIALGVNLYLDDPVTTPERLWQIEAESDAVFLGIGSDAAAEQAPKPPVWQLLRWVEGVRLVEGRVPVDPATGQTANPKYFAGGAVVNGGGSVAAAVRAGKRAARGIHRWIMWRDWEEGWPPGGAVQPDRETRA
jgi:glutamate synthase (NADPH/NADH) small chain